MSDETRGRLRHSDDSALGIARRRNGRYWQYFDADGKRITDRDEIDRLNAIALPPAYRDAWFCPHANGHIQATGYDEKGRKQYRYHPGFRARRDKSKYDRTADFGRALPKLRKRVMADLRKRSLGKDTIAAAIVRLMDSEYLRVGNESYAKDNKSFGATTLRTHHAQVNGPKVRMRFKAKSGVEREIDLTDKGLIRIVRQCHDLPASACFNISTKGASRSRSAPRTSTTISATRPARTSPPSISAPGARARSRSSRSAPRARTASASMRCWSLSPKHSATHRPSRANPMSIRR